MRRRSTARRPHPAVATLLAALILATTAHADIAGLKDRIRAAALQAHTVRATYDVVFLLPSPGQLSRTLRGRSILDYACEAGATAGAPLDQRFVIDMEARGDVGEDFEFWSRSTYANERLMLQRLAGPTTGEMSVLARPARVSEQPLNFSMVFLPLPGVLLIDALENEFTALEELPEADHNGYPTWGLQAIPKPDWPWSKMLSKIVFHIDVDTGVVRHASYIGLQGEPALELEATELVHGVALPPATFKLPAVQAPEAPNK